jgi:hypothetical protein
MLAAMILGVVIGLTALLFLRALWLRFLSPLSAIPGPFFASITNLWRYSVVRRSEMPWENARLHRKCGPLVRIGPTHVSADSIEALKTIYLEKKGFPKVFALISVTSFL